MRKVGYRYREVVDEGRDLRKLLMGMAQEVVDNAEFVHEFESGGVNGVAAKVTQEICMLFEDNYVDSGTRQEEADHHARGTAPSNATADFDRFRFLRHHTELFHSRCPIEQARIMGLGIRKMKSGQLRENRGRAADAAVDTSR